MSIVPRTSGSITPPCSFMWTRTASAQKETAMQGTDANSSLLTEERNKLQHAFTFES